MALESADFNRLVEEHGPALYRLAYRLVGDRHEAEDMVQETFRSAWKSRQRFQQGQGERGWLVAILRRRIADYWRRSRARKPAGTAGLPPDLPSPEPTDQGYADPIQHALNQLPEELREALLLVVVGELTHQQAAEILGVPLGTVLSRVSRARLRLREALLAAGIQET
ncbi:MAG: RNA polymerase sigma factor [Thermoguttaceae bacterium]|nr:RNA polymerase sigma factor [Thermoguttaceae bacterium]MDW8038518.1 RNA polymerase sigma factor [Thermoguttaceae bacterium]